MAKTFRLEATLDHQATGRLAGELAGCAGPVLLDGSSVTHVGGLFAQLVLQANRNTSGDRPVTLVNPSSACIDGLARLGIDAADLS